MQGRQGLVVPGVSSDQYVRYTQTLSALNVKVYGEYMEKMITRDRCFSYEMNAIDDHQGTKKWGGRMESN